jgi:hypothetical protein
MEPISIIVGALAAGAMVGAAEGLDATAKRAQKALRDAVRNRLTKRRSTEEVQKYLDDPNRHRPELEAALREAGVGEDDDLTGMAREFEATRRPRGDNFITFNGPTSGVQVGDNNVMHSRHVHGSPPGGDQE